MTTIDIVFSAVFGIPIVLMMVMFSVDLIIKIKKSWKHRND